MQLLVLGNSGAMARPNPLETIPVDFEAIDNTDYGNICGCCGAYAVEDETVMNEHARGNRGIVVGLNFDKDKLAVGTNFRYIHVQLGEDVLTIKEYVN